ncbi:MAG: hypothetical protein LBU43_05910 [Candidatus Accumulibacter sp.]|nr:hypothetical protein [Accumulibacter sp.]
MTGISLLLSVALRERYLLEPEITKASAMTQPLFGDQPDQAAIPLSPEKSESDHV